MILGLFFIKNAPRISWTQNFIRRLRPSTNFGQTTLLGNQKQRRLLCVDLFITVTECCLFCFGIGVADTRHHRITVYSTTELRLCGRTKYGVGVRVLTRCLAMPSLMAARWVGQNSVPIFRRLWTEVNRIKFACASVRSLQRRFPIDDVLLRSGDIRYQVAKLSEIAPKF